MSSAPRPRGRRPGESGAREAILAAARERFAAFGHDRTRIRDVAADAEVDPALVHYYFGSKDGLFVAAMQLPLRPAEVIGPGAGLGGGRARRADRPARAGGLGGSRQPDGAAGDRAGASAHPGAAAALREFVRHEIVARIASVIQSDRPELRANLVASQIIGLAAARYVAQVEPLASLGAEEIVPLVGPTLQRYVDGPL